MESLINPILFSAAVLNVTLVSLTVLQISRPAGELGWDTVENADYYEINITDISGKNKIDTVQVHSGDMTVNGNRASYSVDATAECLRR